MSDVTPTKLQRLNRNPDEWNGNQIPPEMFPSIYNIAAYNAQSKNPRDQDDQKILYIQLFELTKSYSEGKLDSLTYMENQAFKHPNETHKMLEFLRAAQTPAAHMSGGRWYLWYDPDPLAPLAKDLKNTNMPPQKEEQVPEMQVDFEVDTSQFTGLTTQQKLDSELDNLITDVDNLAEQNNRRNKRDDDSSTSDISMEDRHAGVRKRVELQERKQVELRQRASLPEPPKPPCNVQKDNRYQKKISIRRNNAQRGLSVRIDIIKEIMPVVATNNLDNRQMKTWRQAKIL